MKDAFAEIGSLIDKQSVVYISSVDENGYPNTKAMLAPRKREGIKVIYFHTNTSSMRVRQYRSNPHACVYFSDNRLFRGAMLIGTMEVLEDSVHKEMLWQEGDTMYYPQGVTDPDYCVLKFTAKQGGCHPLAKLKLIIKYIYQKVVFWFAKKIGMISLLDRLPVFSVSLKQSIPLS